MSIWLPRTQHQKAILLASISQRTRFASTLALRRHQITARATLPGICAATRFESTTAQSTSHDPKPSPPTPKEDAPLLSRAWKKVKHEAQHYWHGSKLLVSEVRISSRLQWKILHGESLTRRERRQVRVFCSYGLDSPMNDCVYPVEANHAGLAQARPVRRVHHRTFHGTATPRGTEVIPQHAPVYIRGQIRSCKPFHLFTHAPYDIHPHHQQEEKQRKLLRVRLEMAKFLQETLRESGLKANAHIVGSDAFKEFFLKVRSTGESPSAQDVINVAKLFDDDLTLDNLSRPQLVSMCRYMCINAFGTDNFLRGAIRSRLTNLRRDDQAIDTEGVDSLSFSELLGACQSRGIRTSGVYPARLRDELSTWINLHLHNRVSGVLLILARAFHFDRKPGEDEDGKTTVIKSIESVLSGLPDNLVGCHLVIVVHCSLMGLI